MYFKKAIPSDSLKKYIQNYWMVKEDGYRMIREINPSSNICVCFHIGYEASYKMISKDFSEGQKQSADFFLKKIDVNPIIAQQVIIGPHRSLIIESSDNSIYAFGIEFKIGMRKRFFGCDIATLTDTIIPLGNNDIILSKLADIVSKCKMDDLFGIVDKYLIEKRLSFTPHKIEAEYWFEIINQVSENPFEANVDAISKKLHTSPRHFERVFKQYTGLTPKQFISIQKINKVSERMIEHQGNSLVEILEMCGYYDLTHINRDFKIIGGLPATQVFQNIKQKLVNSPDTLGLNYDVEGVCGFNLLM